MVMIKGKVQPKAFKPEELELHIKSMSMLYDVREKQIKGISITLPTTEINDILIDDFTRLTHENAKVSLRFKVVDVENRISVDLFSRSHRVSINTELIHFLADNELEYKLITS